MAQDDFPPPPAPEPEPVAPVQATPEPTPDPFSDDVKRQAYDIGQTLGPHMEQASAAGETRGYEPIPTLEFKQWVFERSEVAQDIQRVNDMPAPGE